MGVEGQRQTTPTVRLATSLDPRLQRTGTRHPWARDACHVLPRDETVALGVLLDEADFVTG